MMKTKIKKGLWLLVAFSLLLSAAGCGAQPRPAPPAAEEELSPAPTPAPTPHVHDWQDGVCTLCGESCSHLWQDGVCTICGEICAHLWEEGACTVCGEVCPHDSHDPETGLCALCALAVGHRYINGVCTRCGGEPRFVTVPDDYPEEILLGVEEHGTLETYHFPLGEGEIEPGVRGKKSREERAAREMVVYTPPGYDPEEKYDVLIIAPGAGHNAHQWLEKTNRVNGRYPRITGRNLLDGMIEYGYTDSLIVAVVEYYLRGSPADVAVSYEQDLRRRVLPFLAENYGTWASVGEDGELIAAPEHFAYIGVSFGAMVGWQLLPGCTDLFSYWGLYSGGFQHNEELFARMESGVDAERPIHYLYTGDGTLIDSWRAYRNRVIMLEESCSCLEEGKNVGFFAIKKTQHNYADWNISLFNSLQLFFHTRYDPESPAASYGISEKSAEEEKKS